MIKIQTSRLLLTPVLRKDLADTHKLLSLPETDRYNALGIPKYQKDTAAHLNKWIQEMKEKEVSNYTLAIRLQSDNAYLGLLGIKVAPAKFQKAEIWYKLHKDHWNQGYGTEAAKAVIDYGFLKMNLHRIEAGAAVSNKASIRVFEKIGMVHEGTKRRNLPLIDGFADNALYAVLRDEYYSI